MINKQIKMRAYTHTLQMVSEECFYPFEDINQKSFMTKPVRHTQRGIIYPINPNKYCCWWKDRDIESAKELEIVLERIKEDLSLTSWKIDRQDIAVDTEKSYDELYKLNLMFAELFGLCKRKKNVADISNTYKLKKTGIVCTDKYYELCIYDKNEESNDKYPYSRCEFRFKMLSDVRREKVYQTIYNTLSEIPEYIEELNKIKIEALYNKWLEETSKKCKNTQINSLPEFFRRYGNHIYTVDIARGLYNRIYKGNYNNWIKRYRQAGNKIEFYKTSNIVTYCNKIKKAVQRYEKGNYAQASINGWL